MWLSVNKIMYDKAEIRKKFYCIIKFKKNEKD